VTHNEDVFTLEEARRLFAEVRPHIDEVIAARADLAELQADLATDGSSPLGGLPEAKGLEARLHALLEEIAGQDIQVKGYAPMLLDFPGVRDGRAVLWCWLEGDTDIEWYHRVECGFPGRRRI